MLRSIHSIVVLFAATGQAPPRASGATNCLITDGTFLRLATVKSTVAGVFVSEGKSHIVLGNHPTAEFKLTPKVKVCRLDEKGAKYPAQLSDLAPSLVVWLCIDRTTSLVNQIAIGPDSLTWPDLDLAVPEIKQEDVSTPHQGHSVGKTGRCSGNLVFRVEQVIDKQNMLVRYGPPPSRLEDPLSGHRVWMKGFPTQKRLPGQIVTYRDFITITCTKEYKSSWVYARGSVGKLYVFEPAAADIKKEITEKTSKARAERKQWISHAKKAFGLLADVKAPLPPKQTVAKPDPDAIKAEAAASVKLSRVNILLDDGKKDAAKLLLQQIIEEYPKTKAAGHARRLLADWKD
jgi:hypothetical protein